MIIEGLLAIATVPTLVFMFFGTFIGIVFGAIPGLTATMAVAIFLPITYAMEQSASIAFLMSLYIGGISGGLISAILLNIPGTPSSVTTTFDGAPMARKGEAGKALGVAILASTLSTLISVTVLITVAPILARFALKFGSYEYFSICFFALVLLSSMTSDSLLKGFTSAILGILVSLIGVAPVGNVIRFTFGFKSLDLGFAVMPVLIGLFAISDILAFSAKQTDKEHVEVAKNYSIKGLGFKLSDIKDQVRNFLISTGIGVAIGILPGIGGSTSNVIAYSVSKQTSKHPEKYGTGIVDGIIASEAANNACIGGAMIPLLTLGIPGDGPTAILLGGLTIAGITPGPLLFKNHATFVYSIYFAMIIATIMMFIIELFGIRVFVKVLNVPKHYLFPIIISLCVVGLYGGNYQIFDVWAAIIFGVISFIMVMLKFPLPPFILSFLLGNIMETYLIRSLQHSQGNILVDFAKSPIAVTFLAITIVSVVLVAFSKYRNLKRTDDVEFTE